MTALTWGIIALLIAFNGLYVAAEFSAVSVRRSRVRQLAEEGNRLARSLVPTLDSAKRLDRYIAACQVGITVSSLVLGAYGQATLGQALTPLFERWGDMQTLAAQSTSAVVVLIGLTTLQMVLGELVPKSLALQYPTRLALLTVLPMRWSERLMAWFIALLNGSGWVVLRLLRVEPKAHRHLHSAEEIKYLVAESREGGHLRPEEQRRLNQALGLTQRTARELMVPRTRVVGVDRAGGLERAADIAAASPFTRIPLYRESLDHIVGVIHAKDVAVAALSDEPAAEDTLDDLARPILAVHETVSADRVLALMREERGTLAVVVDDFGGTSGIITTEDILSELLGDIADEFKHGTGRSERLPDGRVRLAGDMLLHEVKPWVGTAWDGESDTVGGLVMEHLGRLARPGDTLEIDGVEIEVEALDGRAVRTVLARPVTGGARPGAAEPAERDPEPDPQPHPHDQAEGS